MRTPALLLLLAAPALAADPLRLEAGFSEDGASIRVRLEGPLPARTQIVLRIFGEVGATVPAFEVRDLVLPVREPGRAEALVALPEGARGLRGYRIKAAVPANRQYPDVRDAVGRVAPAEAVLTTDLASVERLRLVTDEEAFVLGLLEEAGRFIVRINRGRSGGPAALEGWKAWREGPRAVLQAGVRRGRVDQRRIFPAVNAAFCSRFVRDLLTTESVWLARAQGIPVMGDEAMASCSERDLEPFAETLRRESLEARLEAARALAAQVEAELGFQSRKADPERWERRRKGWEAWLALWPANLDRLPQGRELGEVGTSLAAWIETREVQDGLSSRLDALTPAPSAAPSPPAPSPAP